MRQQYPDKDYMPFVRASGTDDLACFDGRNTTGQPRCCFVHSFASPGWEDRGWVENFATWVAAVQDAARREREEAEATDEVAG